MDYSLITGLYRKLQPVLVSSPKLYDKLIDEAGKFYEVVRLGIEVIPENKKKEILKFFDK